MSAKNIIYWSPRVLSLLFVAYLSLFALDVAGGPLGWTTVLAFAIHLLPTLILLALLVLAWKYDVLGALVCFGFAAWYVWSAGLERPLMWYAVIALPAIVIGSLYLASWYQKRKQAREQVRML